MSKRKLRDRRRRPLTKSERLHDLCEQLVSQVKQLTEQQSEVINAVLTVSAETELMAGMLEVLKEKGVVTNEEITKAVKETRDKIQNAKQNKSTERPSDSSDRSEESRPEPEGHTDDSKEQSEVPADPS